MANLEKTTKRKQKLKLGMSFWAGVGLMSIINAWKITKGNDAIRYSWIMFGLSIFFLLVCLIYLFIIKQKEAKK